MYLKHAVINVSGQRILDCFPNGLRWCLYDSTTHETKERIGPSFSLKVWKSSLSLLIYDYLSAAERNSVDGNTKAKIKTSIYQCIMPVRPSSRFLAIVTSF